MLPVERLNELAELDEIGAVAPSHYSYMGYTLRPERLLGGEPARDGAAAARGECRRGGAGPGLTGMLVVRGTGTTSD